VYIASSVEIKGLNCSINHTNLCLAPGSQHCRKKKVPLYMEVPPYRFFMLWLCILPCGKQYSALVKARLISSTDLDILDRIYVKKLNCLREKEDERNSIWLVPDECTRNWRMKTLSLSILIAHSPFTCQDSITAYASRR